MKSLSTLFALFLISFAFQTTEIDNLHFLAGTWKMQNKENYETWTLKGKDALEGSAYKIRNGSKQVEEYLSIKISGDKIIYTATVLNQNDAKPVDFVLNKTIKDKLSFENTNHDFPKKIQYTKRNDSTIFVAVLGDNDKGFSYNLIKQK